MALTQTEDIVINIDVQGSSTAEKDIDGVTKSLDEQSDQTEENTAGLEQYSESLLDSAKDARFLGVSVNSLSRGLKAMTVSVKGGTGALKLFRIALISTGIGALLVALGSLAVFFTRSQEGADLLSKALGAIGAVINVILDRISDFGGGLVKLFSGDIRGGLTDMKNSFVGIGDAIKENINRALEFEAALIAIRDAQIILTTEFAKTEQRIALAREASNDLNNSLEDRIAFTKTALLQTRILADAQVGFLKIQAANLKLNLASSKTRAADLQEIADLEASIIKLETQRALSSIRIRNRLQILEKEALVETKVISVAKVEIKKEEIEEIIELEIDLQDELDAAADEAIEAEERRAIERANIIFRSNQKIKADAEETAQFKIDLAELETRQTLELFSQLAGGLANLAGQESKLGKALAIAQAVINVQLGITAALTALTLPGRIAGVAFAIATGLAAIRDIKAEPLPKVQIASSPFGAGGPISGPSHNSASGGVWVKAEGGEYVINKHAMRDPINRAIVQSINDGGQSTGRDFQEGGFINTATIQLMNLEKALANMQPVLILPDLDREQNIVRVTQEVSTLQ